MSHFVFEQYQELRIRGLKFIEQYPAYLNSVQKEQLKNLIKTTEQTKNIPELGITTTLPTPNVNIGFFPIEPLTDPDPKNLTCMKFGNAPLAWYFAYGQYYDKASRTSVTFTLMIFKLELAAPDVVIKSEFPPENAVLWSLSGGVGIRKEGANSKENWYAIPFNICRGKYKCSKNNTFRLDFNNEDSSYIDAFTFESKEPRTFAFNLKFKSYPESKNDSHSIRLKGELKSESEPSYNGENGCVPCIGGVGTIYWSYTRMDTHLTVKTPEFESEKHFKNGLGWFDSQYMQGDFIPNGFIRFLSSLKKPKVIRWIWLNLQFFEPKTQWMISHLVDGPLNTGIKIVKPEVVNLYDEKGVHYALSDKDIKCTIEVMQVAQSTSQINNRSMFFPTKFKIGLATVKDSELTYYVMRRDFGSGHCFLPSGNMNIESAGSLWNLDESRRLGNCFFECNNFSPADELIETSMKLLQSK